MLNKSSIIKVLSLLLLLGYLNVSAAEKPIETLAIISGVGGEFTALNGKGETIKLSDFKGKVVVLAFGYTNCADICPFTLGYLKQLYKLLSPEEQKKTRIVFVTIDPKYDTPEHVQKFVSFFNKDFVGLSGSQQQIDAIVSLYQASYHSLADKGGEVDTKEIRRVTPRKSNNKKEKSALFSHSVTIYLIDKHNLTRGLEYTGTPKKVFAQKIRSLIHEQ